MKKIAIAAALALTALFCFVGCSSGSGNNEHTHTFAPLGLMTRTSIGTPPPAGMTSQRGSRAYRRRGRQMHRLFL